MANKLVFKNKGSKKSVPVTNTVNKAGGKAYSFDKKHCLAQIAATNTFNATYYASSEDNLKLAKDAALALVDDPTFLAKAAIYSRDKSYMKDMPAFILTVLADTDTELFRRIFLRICDNTKMLRNFCQIARSGAATGRVFNLSSGTCRRAIQSWFDSKSPEYIFRSSIGNDPSIKDILKMARPNPNTPQKASLFAYLLGAEFSGTKLVLQGSGRKVRGKWKAEPRTHTKASLPKLVKEYEKFKKDPSGEVPDVDFRMLDSLEIGPEVWKEIAKNAKWTMTRMNLNTFARHGVLKDVKLAKLIAKRLSDPEEIGKAKAFPYQLMMAYKATIDNTDVPHNIRESLQDAMEIAIDNTPALEGQVYVAVDVSGSMTSSVTGDGGYSYNASAVRCLDVAALYAASILRRNKSAELYPFDDKVYVAKLNPRDSVLTNAEKLATYGGGGTDCSCVLKKLNAAKAKGSAVILISDMESWIDGTHGGWGGYNCGTSVLTEWNAFSARNPGAKLICIDLQARDNSQVTPRPNILQVGGFSDQVFEVIASFIEYGHETDHWVAEIEKVSLD